MLWRYLTSLHDQRVLGWMGWVGGGAQASSAPRWPELAPEVVNSNTMCSTYMRENVLDLLARYPRTAGVWPATDRADVVLCCPGDASSSRTSWPTWSSCCGDWLRVEG